MHPDCDTQGVGSWLNRVDDGLAQRELEPEQVRGLQRCARTIDESVDADGPLWKTCRNCDECWRRVGRDRFPERMQPRLPWIGPRYPQRRILLVGINSRDDGDSLAEVDAIGWILDGLRAGRRQVGGRSSFHFRAAAAADAVARSQDGRPLDVAPEPRQVADALLGIARVQAVQCAPLGGRRGPTPEMVAKCPPFLLGAQLENLAPLVVIALGHYAHVGVQRAVPVRWSSLWRENDGHFARGVATIAQREAAILALHHPAASSWAGSFRSLIGSLESALAPAVEPS